MLIRFVEDSVMMFAKFDQKLQQSIAIMDKVDATMRRKLGDTARQVSRELNLSAADVAEGYYFLASAGFTAEQSLKALPAIATFAKAGMMDLAKATELMTQAQSALGMKSEDANQNLINLQYIMDAISAAAAKSQATISQFADALSNKAGASLRMFHKDVSEGVAALAVMADQGVKGRLAGERLDIFLRQVTQAATKHASVFKAYGITIFDGAGKMRHFADIVDDLTKSLGSLSDENQVLALEQLGFQVRTIAVIKSFIGMGDKIREYETLMKSAGGVTEKMAKEQLKTPIEQFGLMKQKINDARMELGEALIPALTDFGNAMADENDPLSAVNALRAFTKYLVENGAQLGKVAGALMWFVTGALSFLVDSLNIVADVIVVGVNVPLMTLGFIVSGVTILWGGMTQAVGDFLLAVTDGALGKGISDLGKKLIGLGMAAGAFSKGRAENSWSAIEDFVKRGSGGLAGFGSGGRDRKIPRPPKGKPDVPGGTPTNDDPPIVPDEEEEKKRANKIENLMDRLTKTILRHSKERTDDQLEDLRELEREFKKLYGAKLPKAVQDGLNKLRELIGKEGIAKMHTDDLDKFIKTVDDPTRWDTQNLLDYIDEMTALRETTEEGSLAWAMYTDAINKAKEALDDWSRKIREEEDRAREADARKRAQEVEERMRRIRRVGEQAADAMADAFERFAIVMVRGSKRGEDAFEQLGRSISRALMGALSGYAMTRARAAYAEAAEAIAKGVGYLSSPFTKQYAAGQFAAAAKFAAVGTMWAALGGLVGGATTTNSGSGMPGNASELGGKRVDDSRNEGSTINIYIDGVDPNNPRHQRLLGDTIAEYSERTGGTINVNRRSA
jgi:TP901 family phage tail tape measure protein